MDEILKQILNELKEMRSNMSGMESELKEVRKD